MAIAPTLDDSVKIIDADTHVVEAPDLWTSRISSKWGDAVPHVIFDEDGQEEVWTFGGKKMYAATLAAGTGWAEAPPDHAKTLAEADPRDWTPKRRLEIMDMYGIQAQVLYPNIGVFTVNEFMDAKIDPELAILLVKAYNDFLVDWKSVAPDRYVAVMTVPFWDLEATKAEITRAHEAGHAGIVFPARMTDFNLPHLADEHWDPVWAQAQEMDLSINFHIGSGNIPLYGTKNAGKHLSYAWSGSTGFLLNSAHVTSLIYGGICHRFPDLKFVSVESGIGWVPFLLETMDWNWHNCGVAKEHPEFELKPSEYFLRQIYGCFWFEGPTGRAAVDQIGSDHFMFETDHPHPTGQMPAEFSAAVPPREFLAKYYGDLPAQDLHNITYANAARIYHLD